MPRIYGDLASWFHLVTPPGDYVREAKLIKGLLSKRGARLTLLELGAGGGNNALHLKKHFDLTLTDISPAMLRVSKGINPECRHIKADMRDLRLKERFDAVLVHDAVMYMLTRADLRKAIRTAFWHLKPGGKALFMPDFLSETFEPRTTTGENTENGRTLRYVEVTRARGSGRRKAIVDFTYLLSDTRRSDRIITDRHIFGLFPRATWVKLLEEAGFSVEQKTDYWGRDIFVCERKEAV